MSVTLFHFPVHLREEEYQTLKKGLAKIFKCIFCLIFLFLTMIYNKNNSLLELATFSVFLVWPAPFTAL